METLRLAFMGFGHSHILGLYSLARSREDGKVVAACEEDKATRDALAAAGRIAVMHASYRRRLGAAADVRVAPRVWSSAGRAS